MQKPSNALRNFVETRSGSHDAVKSRMWYRRGQSDQLNVAAVSLHKLAEGVEAEPVISLRILLKHTTSAGFDIRQLPTASVPLETVRYGLNTTVRQKGSN